MNKGLSLQQKTPEIEKSLNLIKHLKKKQEEEENVVVSYELAGKFKYDFLYLIITAHSFLR